MHQPSIRASIITRRTYCRPLDDEGTVFETWPQVIDRVKSHQRWLWENAQGFSLSPSQEDELAELSGLMLDRKLMPAGRTLWLGGTDIVKRRAASNYNCSFLKTKSVHDIVDAFWLLLQGCGVGFKMETGGLSGFNRKLEIQVAPSTRTDANGRDTNEEHFDSESGVWTINVGDSAEAWAKAAGKLVVGKFPAKVLRIETTEVRPAGTRLKGYGWICAGDSQLLKAFTEIAGIRNRKAGKLLTKLDVLDLVNWLGTVLSTRRSAQAALMDYGDKEWEDFATAKAPGYWEKNPQRAQSNNGLMFWEKPSLREIRSIFNMMVEHGGGEPSFNNAAEARRRAPWFDGFNPCVTGDTWVLTTEGPRKAVDLVGQPFTAIVDGLPHDSTDRGFYPTGEKMVYRVETDRGYSFECTDNHQIQEVYSLTAKSRRTRWTELKDLKVGDRISLHNHEDAAWSGAGSREEGWLVGSLLGDGVFMGGNVETARLSYWGPTKEVMAGIARDSILSTVKARSDCGRRSPGGVQEIKYDRMNLSSTGLRSMAESFGLTAIKTLGDEVEHTSSDFHEGFLSGWFDADGSVCGGQSHGVSVRLTSVILKNLYAAQRMLARLGIICKVYKDRQPEGPRTLPDGKGGVKDYNCQAGHELIISGRSLARFAERVGFRHPAKSKKLAARMDAYQRGLNRERFTARIKSIRPVGVQSVYDCTIPTASQFDGNGVNLHNCFEIILADRGFCNLFDINVLRFVDDHHGLHRAIYLAGRANYRQTLVDLRDGILQHSWHENNEFLRLCGVGLTGLVTRPDLDDYALRQLRNSATAGAYSIADELGLERPKNVTTIKPSGTVSKIMDCTEGAHKPLGRYIFNNVNFSRHDPLVGMLTDAGYDVLDNPTDPAAVLVKIPTSWPTVPFGLSPAGVPVNHESAVDQLERYRKLQNSYCDQNTSITVSYDPSEVPAMSKWFDKNWDSYVGAAFLFRNDPTKTAADLGFAYLPQEVVDAETYRKYESRLKPIDIDAASGEDLIDADCSTGACPVR